MKKLTISILSLVFISSCSTVYYKTWEVFGKEKRDLLRANLEELSDDQAESKEEFSSVLEKIRVKYNISSSNLSNYYDKISNDYSNLEDEVNDINSQIDKVNSIANDLFKEWRTEIYTFTNKKYKSESLKKLRSSKKKFDRFLKIAKESYKNSAFVLKKFKDQVLYVKHNLNAQVVGNLKSELSKLESDLKKLIPKIEQSIKESQQIISEFK